MKTKEEFLKRWFDELLGIAVHRDSSHDDAGRGLFLVGRVQKARDFLTRIYDDLARKDPPPTERPAERNGQHPPAREASR